MAPRPLIPAEKNFRLALAFGALAGAVLIGLSLFSVAVSSGNPKRLAHVTQTRQLIDGIPQQGTAIGRTDAPVTLVEYADLQCPYCGRWSRQAVPELIARYVRSGHLRIEFRGLAFLGHDSAKALQFVEGAAAQHRAWQTIELIYANQGAEGWGWVTDGYLRLVADAAGISYRQAVIYGASPAAIAKINVSYRERTRDHVTFTPTVLVGPTGGQLQRVDVSSLQAQAVIPAIEKTLGSKP
jgi:protein-disulfide isomerase